VPQAKFWMKNPPATKKFTFFRNFEQKNANFGPHFIQYLVLKIALKFSKVKTRIKTGAGTQDKIQEILEPMS
jgi:hypothetical protein